mmetsp:Transcript_39001/g.39703  ORF Transcript_39001/g.39703 Transcript_39001/m.39703 type:complete len:305 (+) Transcript_39001:262-1176(+)
MPSQTKKRPATLTVTIHRCENLIKTQFFGPQDPYCSVYISSNQAEKKRTATEYGGGTRARWNHALMFLIEDLNTEYLNIEVMNENNYRSHNLIGKLNLRISDVCVQQNTCGTYLLQTKAGVDAGEIELSFKYVLYAQNGSRVNSRASSRAPSRSGSRAPSRSTSKPASRRESASNSQTGSNPSSRRSSEVGDMGQSQLNTAVVNTNLTIKAEDEESMSEAARLVLEDTLSPPSSSSLPLSFVQDKLQEKEREREKEIDIQSAVMDNSIPSASLSLSLPLPASVSVSAPENPTPPLPPASSPSNS